MIITCPNCNKSFKIDKSLIPDEGRDLQCGSCNHIWLYIIEEKNNNALKLNEEIITKDIEIKKEIKEDKQKPQEKIHPEIINKKEFEVSEKQENKSVSKTIEKKGSKFFSYIIVFIISFVALIILLNTLKTPLIIVFPGLEIILLNLFETLQDIKLFIIDLI